MVLTQNRQLHNKTMLDIGEYISLDLFYVRQHNSHKIMISQICNVYPKRDRAAAKMVEVFPVPGGP